MAEKRFFPTRSFFGRFGSSKRLIRHDIILLVE
jgi:hypothetical protein